jgi:hypothetical protein
MVDLNLMRRDFKRVNSLLTEMGFHHLYELTAEGLPSASSIDRAMMVEMGLIKWRLAPNHAYTEPQMDGLLALATVYQGERRASSGIYKNFSLGDMSYTLSGADQAAQDLLSVLNGAFLPVVSPVSIGVVR